MIRRRAGHGGGAGDEQDEIDESQRGQQRRRQPQASSSQSSAQSASSDNSSGGVVSNTFVFIFVAFFIAAGFLKHNYRKSGGRVPFFAKLHQQSSSDSSKVGAATGGGAVAAGVTQTSLLSDEEDAALERDSQGRRYHLIFSTDCSPYQHWQSYLVYYTAMTVKQPGHVTRIASGCEGEEAEAMEKWFHNDISFMSKRFHLLLTPNFSQVKNEKGEVIGDYKFFNKPHGLKYFLEHSPQLNYNEGAGSFNSDVADDIIILIDPDMGLMRPITADLSDERETVISARRRKHLLTTTVGPGKPAAQVYGFGVQWSKLDLVKVTGDENTPAAEVSHEDARLYYPAGPPYLGTVADMYKIATSWSSFVPKAYEQYPHLLAEMFAYCIAAAHVELPHQLVDSLMISDVGANGEGWPLIDKIPPEEVCSFAHHNPDHSKYAVPNVVHLCQRYAIGSDWFFSKRRIPADVLYDCSSPLFEEPPADLATRYSYKLPPKGQKKDIKIQQAGRESFMICYLYGLLNEAATFYKSNSCIPSTINLKKTRNLAKEMNGVEQIVL